LFVFGKTGVWEITGSNAGYGFKADDYAVHKISGTPCLSNLSFVLVEGQPYWWNKTGIYTLTYNQMGQAQVASLTDDSIKTFFRDIPSSSKYYAKGAYDSILRRIQWLYRSTEATTDQEKHVYDTILNYDLRTNAFYIYKTGTTGRVEIIGIFDVEGNAIEETSYDVYDGESQVLSGTSTVSYTADKLIPVESVFKYIVNIKEDTADIPEPPAGPSPETFDVYVNNDQVLDGTDAVEYTTVV
jgi:hypothetical protein